MVDRSPPPSATVADRLGRLVALLRSRSRDPAREEEALQAVVDALSKGSAVVEAGFEHGTEVDDETLKHRLLARMIDSVTVEADATREEILALAAALAEDDGPIPTTASVKVELVHPIAPSSGRSPPPSEPDRLAVLLPEGAGPESRQSVRPNDGIAALVAKLTGELDQALRRSAWTEGLHIAQATIRILTSMPDQSMRGAGIGVRRLLTRPVVEAFIQLAYRVAEEQPRAVEVLRWGGLDAAELMLEQIRQGESVGPRGFLIDALGQMPDAYPLVVPLLNSPRPHEARHAAELLGRLGLPRAIEPLKSHVGHPDERVRLAVIEALGRFQDKLAVEPLRRSLAHASARTRVQAGRALAGRQSGALAMPLLAALEAERDESAWRDLLASLARIDAPESAAALVRVATERKHLLGKGGRSLSQRLEVVSALAEAGTVSSVQALDRIAVEGDAPLKEAARKALEQRSARGLRP